ncbi:MAG: helix-turn-helix transcriptional regulator [Acidobacteria bacterium]|nr:helix-turn-helix transcriptional regulator [Acidobacteriota bacterium]
MPNLIHALRNEITRLAKKEIKGQITALKAASAKYRRDIAELKRVTSDLQKRLAAIEQQERKRAKKPPPSELAAGTRFSPKGLKSHRARLGLSAADYGLLAGVSGKMIYKYERGETKPRRAQVAKLVAVRDLGKREARRRLALLKQ